MEHWQGIDPLSHRKHPPKHRKHPLMFLAFIFLVHHGAAFLCDDAHPGPRSSVRPIATLIRCDERPWFTPTRAIYRSR
ncbi:hypothetical protein K461DRAFT_165404 [Myriangium duriaei CBS 260.36]|uniref:Secreted protein n=1 Tax=Myriangium duriaei CBS 260.36 TaxID=1168546 RepID=A0A9P4MED0_9PEZI|nr:hypothetical protein K461DRAFT_165404 [Myriangium duriaei CBS 260.36]